MCAVCVAGCEVCAVGGVHRCGCLGCGSEGAVGWVVQGSLYGQCPVFVLVSLLWRVMALYGCGGVQRGDVGTCMCHRQKCRGYEAVYSGLW